MIDDDELERRVRVSKVTRRAFDDMRFPEHTEQLARALGVRLTFHRREPTEGAPGGVIGWRATYRGHEWGVDIPMPEAFPESRLEDEMRGLRVHARASLMALVTFGVFER